MLFLGKRRAGQLTMESRNSSREAASGAPDFA
jgi:hypothetical protein